MLDQVNGWRAVSFSLGCLCVVSDVFIALLSTSCCHCYHAAVYQKFVNLSLSCGSRVMRGRIFNVLQDLFILEDKNN
ncbi:hypothetical protein B0H15DRAFT_185843 [Mycena belliarum]|uniref:Uncharacterized protein n=1 Tax=Mycena belliarum TaxID=1033014 RepID=A0AAD6U8P7_9AGAR|nr:hypothetical protein B0H15DRAFT_848531 [Mycena belliae]KAJ7092050.1 hypothetical protein B0H15DRAFT_185843 [Mycena belliae]